MRDDFRSKIKETLAKRVGFHCSNPACKKLTIGPNSIDDKATNIGVAAHITAASINGPRYDISLSSKDRVSILNGIWLCQSCAKLIDSDVEKYSPELLRSWKKYAEIDSSNELTNEKVENSKDIGTILKLMPDLIKEFKSDLEDNPLARDFILLKKTWVFNSSNSSLLVYYYDDHADLDSKIRILENKGFIRDITKNNTKRYVLTEDFVDILSRL